MYCHLLLGFGHQHFEGTLTVDGCVILAENAALFDDIQTLTLCDGSDLRQREQNFCALHDTRGTLLVEEAHESLTRLEVHDGLVGLELGIGSEGLSCCLHGLLVFRRVGSQRVLHTVAELSEDILRDIGRTLGDEVDTHTL